MLFGVNSMDTRTQSLTLQSKLKTCAILHFKFKGKPRIAKFYWGSLLDFPEYRIGDVIRWSNYSIGESDIVETVHARAYIDGAHHHELVIHIHQNTIISCEILADRLQHHGVKPFVYIGDEWLPSPMVGHAR